MPTMLYNSRMSGAERSFVQHLEKAATNNLFGNHVLYNQYYSRYTMDFAFPDLKLNIEVDRRAVFQTARDDILIENGWTVIRLADDEVIFHPDRAIGKIVRTIKEIEYHEKHKNEPEFIPPPITNSIMELEL